MDYKTKYLEELAKANGHLISKSIAAKILGVNRSTITNNKKLKTYKVFDNVFVSLQEVLESDIKPKKVKNK